MDYKGLALDTPLPTPSGWTTMRDVQVGDELIGADGRPCRVTVKSDVHHRPCYEVRFTDGTSVVCDNVHLWSVHLPTASGGWQEQVVDADALHRLVQERPTTSRGRRRPFVRSVRPVELPEADLPLDPWLLGAWLGDGATRDGGLTVGHADRDDMLTLLKQHWTGDVSVAPWSETSGALAVSLQRPRPDLCPYGHDTFRDVQRRGATYRRCTAEGEHASRPRWNASFSERLRRAGLSGDKHIPAAFLRGSAEQRLALLQGLMDTDGSWNGQRARAVFVTTSAGLASGVRELVQTLGGTASHWQKPYTSARGPRTVYRVEFRPRRLQPVLTAQEGVPRRRLGGVGRACGDDAGRATDSR